MMAFILRSLLLGASIGQLALVYAQTSDAVCESDWAWALNSRQQTPCQVAAYLLAPCANNQWNVPALRDGQYYTPPSVAGANQCSCSTVVYQLMSACGSCQGQAITTWSTWRTNCTDAIVSIREYPRSIPGATSVQAWAYLDVLTEDRFNATAAQQAAPLPETSAVSTQSSTPSGSSSSPTSEPSSPVSSETATPSKSNKTPAIVGGAVGGVVGLGLIICLVIFLFKRNSQKTKKIAPSAEFSKVIPPGSPMPANFDPAAVGFRSRTNSPLSNGLNDANSGYGMMSMSHSNGSGVVPFQGSPWSPPPVGHTPAPSGGAYSSVYTPPPPGMGRNHLNYTPPPGSVISSNTPSLHQHSHSYSGSINYNPTPVYQSMNPYGTTSGSNPSYTTRNTNVPEI